MKQWSRGTRILILLLLLTFALRVYRVPNLSLRADEAATVFEASVPWDNLVRALSKPGPQQPLYLVLLHGWMKVAGDGELAVRYLSLMSGVLLLPLVYVLGRRLFPDELGKVGLWASLLVAINPLLVWDAQDNRMYPLLAVFNITSFYFSLSILQHRGGRWHWLGYVASTTLALYTHFLAFFIVLTENIVWAVMVWRFPQRTRRIVCWLAAQFAVLLLFTPWLVRAMNTVAGYTTDFLGMVEAGELLRRAMVGLSLGRSVDPTPGTIMALGFLLVAGLAFLALLASLRQKDQTAAGALTEGQSVLVLFIYLVVPIVCIAAFSVLRFPIFDERYIMLSLPPFLLILGYGLSNLSRPGARRWLAVAGLIWILVASSYSLYNYYHVSRHMKGVDWRTYVRVLLENAQPGDVLIQNYPDPGLTYHLRDRMPRVLLPMSYPVDAQSTEDELRRLSEAHPRIWLQPQTFKAWDSEGLVETWLDRNAYKVAEQSFGTVRLALYLPPDSYLETMEPVEASVGDWARLAGYTLGVESGLSEEGLWGQGYSSQPVAVEPGDLLYLTLVWESLKPQSGDYTVFTHVYDEGERIWGQKDSPPLGGAAPTSQWQVGESIMDQYSITVDPQAPPGEYRIVVGMYDPATGERLPVTAKGNTVLGENRIMVATLEVER